MNERTKDRWTTALVIVSIVAGGTAVAGVLQPAPEPQLTTAIPEPVVEPEMPVEYEYVAEPVEFPVDIPGCDAVQEPAEGETFSASFVGEQQYDNPKFPWFSEAKATAMSVAVADLLPGEIDFATPDQSFRFGPIMDFGDEFPGGSTDAWGTITNGDVRGSVQVSVQQLDFRVPDCTAGQLDERRTVDGIVVDLNDTWSELNGVRTTRRSAQAYIPDGSWVHASASDSINAPEPTTTGGIPLTRDDLVRIVVDPRLRVSTPAPTNTPAPTEDCNGYSQAEGPPLTREQAERLDGVLDTVAPNGRTLNPLQLAGYSSSILCTALSDIGAGTRFTFSITGGQPLPVEERPDAFSGNQKTFRTTDDGTVVQTERSYYSVSSMEEPDDGTMQIAHSVSVTRADGTAISVSATSTTQPALTLEQLESIALTSGLEL